LEEELNLSGFPCRVGGESEPIRVPLKSEVGVDEPITVLMQSRKRS